jgi:hypothetical protein
MFKQIGITTIKRLLNKKFQPHLREMIDESALFSLEQKRKMGIISPITDGDRSIDGHIMEKMQEQLNSTPEGIFDSLNNKDYQESIRKIKEIRED